MKITDEGYQSRTTEKHPFTVSNHVINFMKKIKYL